MGLTLARLGLGPDAADDSNRVFKDTPATRPTANTKATLPKPTLWTMEPQVKNANPAAAASAIAARSFLFIDSFHPVGSRANGKHAT